MDRHQAEELRELLRGTEWVGRTTEFARALRTTTRTPGGLLLVGPPDDEPWHLTAHLSDEAEFGGVPEITPTLVRWDPPPGAPSQLAVGFERFREVGRGESLLVVSETDAPAPLLERVDDVRRKGVGIFTLDTGDRELESLANEVLRIDDVSETPLMSFEGAQHLVSIAAGDPGTARVKGFRARLGRFLDVLSGPAD